jgi:hypothetical protein
MCNSGLVLLILRRSLTTDPIQVSTTAVVSYVSVSRSHDVAGEDHRHC